MSRKTMPKKILLPILLLTAFFMSACVYIVLPEGLESPEGADAENASWAGIVTNVSESETGDLRIELAIRNDTGAWSTMRAVDGQPAVQPTMMLGLSFDHRVIDGARGAQFLETMTGLIEQPLLLLE